MANTKRQLTLGERGQKDVILVRRSHYRRSRRYFRVERTQPFGLGGLEKLPVG
jgi:hypothetical protein